MQAGADGVVAQKCFGNGAQLLLHIAEGDGDAVQHPLVHIFEHTAHAVDREDDPAAGGGVEEVEDFLAQFPALHKQALEAQRVGQQAQPQQVAVDAAHLHPDRAQVGGARRDLDVHQLFQALAVAHAVAKAADAADALGNIDIFFIVLGLDEFFQPAVHKPDAGHRLYDDLVLEHEVEVYRLGSTGCCGPNGTMLCFAIFPSPLFLERRFIRNAVELAVVVLRDADDMHAEQFGGFVFLQESAGERLGDAGEFLLVADGQPQRAQVVFFAEGIAELAAIGQAGSANLHHMPALLFEAQHRRDKIGDGDGFDGVHALHVFAPSYALPRFWAA